MVVAWEHVRWDIIYSILYAGALRYRPYVRRQTALMEAAGEYEERAPLKN